MKGPSTLAYPELKNEHPGLEVVPKERVPALQSFITLLRDAWILTKPGIILLVGVTTFTGAILARPEASLFELLLPTLITLLAAQGAAVWNQFYDRDLDLLMERTRLRPLPAGRFPAPFAAILALSLMAFSLFLSFRVGGILPFLTTLAAILSYAWLYTMVLKRRTPLCTEIGGLSGSLPPLIGWFFMRSDLTPLALFLPVLLFFWQPPHFWILGTRAVEQYRQAGIPIYPVTHGLTFTRWRILGYSLLFVLVSLFPFLWGMAGSWYGATALGLGVIHTFLAISFLRGSPSSPGTLGFFLFSLFHLFALCASLTIELRFRSPI